MPVERSLAAQPDRGLLRVGAHGRGQVRQPGDRVAEHAAAHDLLFPGSADRVEIVELDRGHPAQFQNRALQQQGEMMPDACRIRAGEVAGCRDVHTLESAGQAPADALHLAHLDPVEPLDMHNRVKSFRGVTTGCAMCAWSVKPGVRLLELRSVSTVIIPVASCANTSPKAPT